MSQWLPIDEIATKVQSGQLKAKDLVFKIKLSTSFILRLLFQMP